MALTITTAVRNAIVDSVTTLIDAGTGDGYLEIGTAAMAATLVVNNFADPSFGAGDTGVATANAIDDGTATGAGTAAEARIRDSDDTDIITGLTVGTSASNINLTSTSISTDDVISITSMTITMPAS